MESTNNANNPSTPGNEEGPEQMTQQVAAFQKIWMETITKLVQTSMTLPPDSAPPEVMRQLRSGVFQGLAKSWDEFLRTPQFLEGMKQWTETLITMRKWSNDMLTRSHHEMQGTAREDIDNIMLAVRHMEKRLLDRMEQLEAKVGSVSQPTPSPKTNGRAPALKSSPALKANRNPTRTRKAAGKARKNTV